MSKNVTPASAAACIAASDSSSSVSPHAPPIAHAPKPISDTSQPVFPSRLASMRESNQQRAASVRISAMATKALGDREVWFLTGSQELYGDEVLRQVDEHAREIAGALDSEAAIPVRVAHRPVVKNAESIREVCLEANAAEACVGVIAWMHTFSPAKMWIAGLASLQKPLLHLHTQFNRDLPWAEIDMDFMNLNQSAHGDREFGFMETRMGLRRKTVVGHWSDPAVVERIGDLDAGRVRLERGAAPEGGPLRRQHAPRRGHRGRQGRVPAPARRLGQRLRDRRARRGRRGGVPTRRSTGSWRRTWRSYEVAPELRPGGGRHESLREAARIEAGLRSFLEDGGFMAFTDTFEDLGALPQLPGIAVQRLMADGYGFGAEGDWKTAALVRVAKVMSAGLDGGTSFMEDYTYHLAPEGPKVLGAHMLEVCPSIAAREADLRDPSALDRREGRPRAARVHRGSRARRRRRPARPRRQVPVRR